MNTNTDAGTLTVENTTITILEEEYEALKHINVVNGCLKVKMRNGFTVRYGGGLAVIGDVYTNHTVIGDTIGNHCTGGGT